MPRPCCCGPSPVYLCQPGSPALSTLTAHIQAAWSDLGGCTNRLTPAIDPPVIDTACADWDWEGDAPYIGAISGAAQYSLSLSDPPLDRILACRTGAAPGADFNGSGVLRYYRATLQCLTSPDRFRLRLYWDGVYPGASPANGLHLFADETYSGSPQVGVSYTPAVSSPASNPENCTPSDWAVAFT